MKHSKNSGKSKKIVELYYMPLVMSFILGGTHEAHAAVAEPTNVTFSGFWNYKIKWKGVKNVNGYEIKVQYAYENGGYAGTYYYVTSKNAI